MDGVPASLEILQNVYVQYGVLGILLVGMVIALRFLFFQAQKWEERYNASQEEYKRLNKEAAEKYEKLVADSQSERERIDTNHRVEWDRLKAEHHTERLQWSEKMENTISILIQTMKENAEKFSCVVEGTLKTNTEALSDVRNAINQCKADKRG